MSNSLSNQMNFWVTNHIPRLAASRLMARVAQIENPVFVKPALWLWSHLGRLQLQESKDRSFRSIHHCFTRELKAGMRPIDSSASMVSPCDGILGAHGVVEKGLVLQVKGMPYALEELLAEPRMAAKLEGYRYLTIRITASMYHRLHSPCDLTADHLSWMAGDCWNVNPPALQRVEKLFCKNHRAVLSCRNTAGEKVVIVPVAAVLVGAMRLHALQHLRDGNLLDQHLPSFSAHLKATPRYSKGQELGWFEHGSTVVMLVPPHYALLDGLDSGSALRMGQGLLHTPSEQTA